MLLYDDLTDELQIYSQDLQIREQNVPLNLGGDDLIDIVQLPSSLVYYTKREIGFYRFNTGKVSNTKCESKIMEI